MFKNLMPYNSNIFCISLQIPINITRAMSHRLLLHYGVSYGHHLKHVKTLLKV